MKTDSQLKHDIDEELRWDPRVNDAKIDVNVNDGAVSLLGAVDTYADKWAAKDAARRVFGVRSVAEDLTVKLRAEHERSDAEIVAAVGGALAWDVYVPETVTASILNGWLTLEGAVPWNYQREAAARAVRHIAGVIGVSNAITLQPRASAAAVKEKILIALKRQATLDASSIDVEISGGKVTLTGHASSWQTIEDAANAAWAAPGVTDVLDEVKRSMTF